jgi:hypothetical protein
MKYILKKWLFQFRALTAKNFSPRTPPEKCKISRYCLKFYETTFFILKKKRSPPLSFCVDSEKNTLLQKGDFLATKN